MQKYFYFLIIHFFCLVAYSSNEVGPAHIIKFTRKFSPPDTIEAIDIDSTVRSLVVSLTSGKLFEARIYYPDGKEVKEIPDKVIVQKFSSGINYRINEIPPGQWKIEARSHGEITVDIQSITPIRFDNIHYMDSILGKDGYMDVPVDRTVRAGAKLKLMAVVPGNDVIKNIFEFQIRSTDGKIIKRFKNFKKGGTDVYDLGKITVPGKSSRLYISGEDRSGYKFQRMYPQNIEGKKE